MMNALILTSEGFEDLELFYPFMRFQEEGFDVQIASKDTETITGQHGYRAFPDITLEEIREPAWDILLIPGTIYLEEFASLPRVKEIIRDFMDADNRVVAIGKGLLALAIAGVLGNRQVVTPKGMKNALGNSKAIFRDDPVIFDGNLVTCQSSRFLPHLTSQLLQSMGLRA